MSAKNVQEIPEDKITCYTPMHYRFYKNVLYNFVTVITINKNKYVMLANWQLTVEPIPVTWKTDLTFKQCY